MGSKYKIVVIHIVLACACFSLGVWIAPRVHAETSRTPGLPFQIYGVVSNNTGSPIAHASIEAYIKGIFVASTTSDTKGNYGITPNLFVIPDPDGKYIGTSLSLRVQGTGFPYEIPFVAGGLENMPLMIEQVAVPQAGSLISSSIIKTMPESSSSMPEIKDLSTVSVSQPPPQGLSTSTPVPQKYRGDILHLQKDHARYYKSVNPSYYEPTGMLGTTAGIVVIVILSWVFYQNYRHARKKGR
jgi:hypothetical protein